MGLFDLLRAAVQPAIGARAGYLEGQDVGRERARKDRIEDEELALKKEQQQAAAAEARARGRYYDAYAEQRAEGDIPVVYRQIGEDIVPLPSRLPRRGRSGITSDDAAGRTAFDPTITTQDFERGLTGGSVAPVRQQGQSPLDTVRSAVRGEQPDVDQQGPGGVLVNVPVGKAPPKTPPRRDRIVGADGYYYNWDEPTQRYVKSNVKAPAKAYEFSPNSGRGGTGSVAEARLRAKTALDEATKFVPRPSKVPQPKALIPQTDANGKIKFVPNPAYGDRMKDPEYARTVRDSIAYEHSTLEPLRKNLYSATVPELGERGAVPVPPSDTAAAARTAPQGSASSQLGPEQQAARQQEFNDAATKYQTLLKRGVDPAKAKAAYDAAVSRIAAKYGARP